MGMAQLINACDLLTDQHTQVDALFAILEGDGGGKREAFVKLADLLAAHATIEEKIFYPRVMSQKTDDMLHESVEEHLGIKRVLADMLTMKLDSDEFAAKVSVLKEQVSHHAHEEEEEKLFPIVKKAMSADELAAMGNELIVMFEDLMGKSPRNNVPSETKKAAQLPAV